MAIVFYKGTFAKYEQLTTKNEDALYFCEPEYDSNGKQIREGALYLGSKLIASDAKYVLAAQNKNNAESYVGGSGKTVTKIDVDENGHISVEIGDISITASQVSDFTQEFDRLMSYVVATFDDIYASKVSVDTLIGTTEGDDSKSVRTIAQEEVAKIVAGADEDFDTLKEIADWIGSDTTGAAELQASLSAVTKELGGTQTTGGFANSRIDTIENKLEGIEEGADVNSIESISVNNTKLIPDSNKAVNIDLSEYAKLDDLSELGAGDMLKSRYDTNNNGVVDNSEKLGGKTLAQIQGNTTETIESCVTAINNGLSWHSF